MRIGDQFDEARNQTKALLALKNSAVGNVASRPIADSKRRILSENLEEFIERRIGAHEAQAFDGPLSCGWVRIVSSVVENERVGALGRDTIAREHSQEVERPGARAAI